MSDLGRPSDPLAAQTRRRGIAWRRAFTIAGSVVCHGLVLAVVAFAQPETPPPVELRPILVEMVQPSPKPVPIQTDPKPPTPEPPAPAPPKPKPAPKNPPPPPKRIEARRVPAPPDVKPLLVAEGPASSHASEVSDGELAGAATAGSGGGGGGGCDMPGLLQRALRKDRHVQAALASAQRGRAIRVWNGDWVRHPGQEGDGLAAVREAIMWEVGFAPEACRREPVRGLVMLSLNDGPGAAKIVVGAGHWRWTDMLFSRSGGRGAPYGQR